MCTIVTKKVLALFLRIPGSGFSFLEVPRKGYFLCTAYLSLHSHCFLYNQILTNVRMGRTEDVRVIVLTLSVPPTVSVMRVILYCREHLTAQVCGHNNFPNYLPYTKHICRAISKLNCTQISKCLGSVWLGLPNPTNHLHTKKPCSSFLNSCCHKPRC